MAVPSIVPQPVFPRPPILAFPPHPDQTPTHAVRCRIRAGEQRVINHAPTGVCPGCAFLPGLLAHGFLSVRCVAPFDGLGSRPLVLRSLYVGRCALFSAPRCKHEA